MIQLQFRGIDDLWKELDNKVEGIQEIVSVKSKNDISKAVFTITSKKFLSDFALEAASNPSKYHHMFEWKKVGNKSAKLFKIKRGTLGAGNLSISFNFQKSKTQVPIPKALTTPGRTGKSVTKRHIFFDKAEVMESGRPVTFTTKQYIAFLSGGDTGRIRFVPPRTLVRINNPGGRMTAGSFDKYVTKWYSNKVDAVLKSSGLFDNIGNAVAKSLANKGSGQSKAREAIRMVTEKYSQGVTEL